VLSGRQCHRARAKQRPGRLVVDRLVAHRRCFHKYLVVILNADNKGEGGIIALVALLNPWHTSSHSQRYRLMLIGLFGAALLYGDGTITPAISVLSAVEGLENATPALTRYVVPIAVVILLLLFFPQRHGTTKIGTFFGPVMLAWFAVIGLLGLNGILSEPGVLVAVRPDYAIGFLSENGLMGFIILGTVFLVVTGAETLYADMGHFGRKPIRLAWFAVALPALLLNYFGQGALILGNPEMAEHPFYGLSPRWMIYPLVALATLATVIASQAVISGTFSLTRQAVQLGQLPRLRIVQTDTEHFGQVYVPAVNWALMIATIWLVLGFRTSTNLGSVYGLAVSLDMVITTVLAYFVARRWKWHPLLAALLALAFLVVDLAFFGANLFKIASGGWYPLSVAMVVFTIMTVWRQGLNNLGPLTQSNREKFDDFLDRLTKTPPQRVPGTAVFMTGSKTEVPSLLSYLLEHSHMLHERVVLVTVATHDVMSRVCQRRNDWKSRNFVLGSIAWLCITGSHRHRTFRLR
jgi:KUP system potassium uptake protein